MDLVVGNPWGFAAFLGLPLVVLLHLFRQRYRKQPIAGLFLWGEGLEDRSGGRRLHRLESSASLWLELLLVALLAAYLLDLRSGRSTGSRHLVVVLDSSASLSARDGENSAADRARQRIARLVADSPSGTRVSLILAASPPLLLVGPSAPADEVVPTLQRWEPALRGPDLASALALARELAGAETNVQLVSDRILYPEDAPPWLAQHAIGRAQSNSAILHASRRRSDEGERVFIQLRHFGPQERELRIRFVQENREVHATTLRLTPGKTRGLALDLKLEASPLEVLLPEDALAIDNRALLLRAPTRTLRCFEEVSGKASRSLRRALAAVRDCEITSELANAHLVFREEDGPPLPRDAWLCRMATRGEPAEDVEGPWFIDAHHPLTQGCNLAGVLWGGAAPTRLPGLPLIAREDRDLCSIEDGTPPRIHFNLDPASGSLARAPDWPILVANLVEMRRAALPGSPVVNLPSGASLEYTVPSAKTGALIHRSPDGRQIPIPGRGRQLLEGWDAVGLHSIEAEGELLHQVAVNFHDASESDLDLAATEEREASRPDVARNGQAPRPLRQHLLLIGLALLCFFLNARVLRGERTR